MKGGCKLKEPKSKRGRRTIDLPVFVVEALARHLASMTAEGHRDAGSVFCTPTGGFLRNSTLIDFHANLLASANVHYRKFHVFRHTHVSELLARSVSVVDVARRIGDRPEVVLKTYAHFLPSRAAHIVDQLEELYS